MELFSIHLYAIELKVRILIETPYNANRSVLGSLCNFLGSFTWVRKEAAVSFYNMINSETAGLYVKWVEMELSV